ncbi:MAG: DNA topoisomerase III [Selenomonadaceae bacterium]|nr:DNA topoisomerase III [Selenomonadaceae bacterium]
MRLYIAEKPSMGREIAACLAPPHNVNGKSFIATGDGVVTWLYGHVLEQDEPEDYDPKYKLWAAEDLPIIPLDWKLHVVEGSSAQFDVVKKLIGKADEIVHAGDPDREGQLLVDEVLDYVGNKKPVKRILLNALDEKSIKRANANLRDNSEFVNLKQSALARSRADWLIGMNLSRAYTLAARRAGHRDVVLPIGRVKTPTLALIVRREREIKNFKPVDYYLLRAEFEHANGSFVAQWKPSEDFMLKAAKAFDPEGRLIDKQLADEMLKKFKAKPHDGQITLYETKEKREAAPLPFSLSALQVAAGKQFGYDPQQVLDIAQRLYEKKLTTYPRSDCSFLPTNQFKDAPTILRNFEAVQQLRPLMLKADAKFKSRAWNDKKISAHHAIIPTLNTLDPRMISPAELNVYLLIARGYAAQFHQLFVYDETNVAVDYKEEKFGARGKVIKQLGWKELYPTKKKPADDEDAEVLLPSMSKGDAVEYKSGSMLKKTTKPPPRFTPSSLVQGMKDIHKYVKNPESKKQLKDVYGIGTEATRATIIDELIKRKFLSVTGKKKELEPTEQAYLLIDMLPDDMTYPDATAIWEDKLHSMSEGSGTLEEFLSGQVEFTKRLCAMANDATAKLVGDDKILCPRCGRGIMVKRKGRNGEFWGCTNYPSCRMSCDDRDGKPAIDLRRAQRSGQAFDDDEEIISSVDFMRRK